MGPSDLYAQFDTAYKNAKLLAKQNEALLARDYIITCMEILGELYKTADSIMERAKLYAHIRDFKKISALIFEEGISAGVKTWFGISEIGENGRAKVENPSRIEKTMEDNSINWAADIFAKNSPSVVIVTAKSGSIISNGTGFVISEKGYLLTNDHVVFDESRCEYYKKISISAYGCKDSIPIEIISSDKKSDVALCRFDNNLAGNIPAVKRIPDYSKLLSGYAVVVIGNGLSMGLAPLTGTVKLPHDDADNLVTTVPSNHGDSGGPVFNSKGECVGINKSITVSVTRGTNTVEAQGITNATPMDKIEELLNKWCKQNAIEL